MAGGQGTFVRMLPAERAVLERIGEVAIETNPEATEKYGLLRYDGQVNISGVIRYIISQSYVSFEQAGAR